MFKAIVQSGTPDNSGRLRVKIQSGKSIPDTFTISPHKKIIPQEGPKTSNSIVLSSCLKKLQLPKLELFKELLISFFHELSDPDVKNLVFQALFRKLQQLYEEVTEIENRKIY